MSMWSSGNYLSVKVLKWSLSIIQPREGTVALGQEFVQDWNKRQKKKTGESNLQTPINDRASKEVRDRAIDPDAPGMSVEKLGRNSAKTKMGKEEKKEKGLNSRATEFSRDSSSGIRWSDGVVAVASTAGLGLLHATSAIGSCPPVLRPMFDPPIDRRWFER